MTRDPSITPAVRQYELEQALLDNDSSLIITTTGSVLIGLTLWALADLRIALSVLIGVIPFVVYRVCKRERLKRELTMVMLEQL